MKKLLPLLITLSLLCAGSAFAQTPPDSTVAQARIAAQQAFSQRSNGNSWELRRHKITKTPASIFNGPPQALQLQGANPKAKAIGFFARHKEMFGLRPSVDQLVAEYTREQSGFVYVQLEQQYKGVPVYTGGYKVTMTREGNLRMISGEFFPDIDVGVTPGLSASQAGKIASEAVSSGSVVNGPKADLIVYPGEGQYALAYKVHVATGPPPEDWLVFVDAQSGEVLKTENVTVRSSSVFATLPSKVEKPSAPSTFAASTTTGSGKVYLDNPNDGSTSTENLPRLDGNGSSLDGTYVRAMNRDASEASPTTYPSTYYFAPSNTHFDEVNLYYHVDRYAKHLSNDAGFPGLGRTIEAYAHHGTNSNETFYDLYNREGNGKQLYFSDGDGVVYDDTARENDAIYHEFTHAVLDHLGIAYTTIETQALHEGTSDYLAASYAGIGTTSGTTFTDYDVLIDPYPTPDHENFEYHVTAAKSGAESDRSNS